MDGGAYKRDWVEPPDEFKLNNIKRVYTIHSGYTDTVVGKIYEDEEGKYRSELLCPDDRYDFPIDLFGYNRDWDRNNSEIIRSWLEDRVLPKTRQFIDEILLENNIDHWDLITLLKLNHGRTVNDKYSVVIEERQ